MENTIYAHQISSPVKKTVRLWAYNHPRISFIVMLIGMPAGLLGAVYTFAGIVVMPISYVFGWI